MTEFIIIFISISFFISLISHISINFISKKELNLICSLCIICVVLIPMVKSIPNILDHTNIMEIKINVKVQETQFESINNSITQYVEESVKELIASTFSINANVNAKISFEDMSAIKITEIIIYVPKDSRNSQVSKLIKETYYCEVKLYEDC